MGRSYWPTWPIKICRTIWPTDLLSAVPMMMLMTVIATVTWARWLRTTSWRSSWWIFRRRLTSPSRPDATCSSTSSGLMSTLVAHPLLSLTTGSTYVLLAASSSSFRATVIRNSAIGPSLLLARWPGMPYRTPLETQPCQPVLSDALWKLSSFLLISVLAH